MLFPRTNMYQKLLRERSKDGQEQDILDQVQKILVEDRFRESVLIKTLSSTDNEHINEWDADLLDPEKIFTLEQIKNICVDYRLRFLSSKYFKGKYPQSAIAQIKYLENKHHTELGDFKIIAPSKMFVLEKADDPLLFAPLGNGYFYMVAQWGNDLHPLRKWLMWPYKSFENLIIGIILVSLCATLLVPNGLFTKEQSFSQDIMVFFFMFKSIAAIVLFYGFALGKNFNTAIWNSKYDKTR